MVSKAEAKLYIWETVFDSPEAEMLGADKTSVGHASMELPDGSYLSVRPKNPGSVNPFTILFPVAAEAKADLEEDEECEGRLPDRTISIPLTKKEVEDASAEVSAIKEGIASGSKKYQLLPGFGALKVAEVASRKEVFETFSENPFSDTNMDDPERSEAVREVASVKATHCSASVVDALEKAGVSTPSESDAPWKITPSDLGNFFDPYF